MSRSISCGLLAMIVAGCVTTESSYRPKDVLPPPPGPAHQVHAAWENRVITTQDVANGGAPLPCIGGRMYLFGAELGHPTTGDGAAVVELANLDKLDAKGKPVVLERWEIDKVALKRFLKKDMIGWGYTLMLPWGTYSPEITKVQMQIRYVPEKGLPMFSPPAVVALRGDTHLTMSQRQIPVAVAQPSAQEAAAAPQPPPEAQLPPPPVAARK